MRHRLVLASLLLVCCARPAAAAPAFSSPLYGNESVAATDGAWGFMVNPAAGGLRYPAELLVARTELEPTGTLWRGVWSHAGAAIAGSTLSGGERTWMLGFGGGQDWLRLGASVNRIREPDGSHATDYAIGFLSRPMPWVSLGLVGDHVGQPSLLGTRLDRTYTAGVAVRPLALARTKAHDLGTRLTLSADLIMVEGAPRREAHLRFGGELELAHGLALKGAVQDHGSFQLGVGLLGSRAGYHGSAAFDRDQRRLAVTHAISLHQGEERSIFTGPRASRAAVMTLGGELGDEALSGVTIGGGGMSTRSAASAHRVLERALTDPLTRGVLLDLRGVSTMAQLEELRPRVARLRAAGKPVVAYLEGGGGRGDLYLASACDRVVASDEAIFVGLGLRAERRYYRSFLADWGVRIDRSSTGRYKSAYRNFSVDSTPPADREVIERALDTSQDLFVNAVAGDRRMDRARLLTVLDGRAWPTRELQKAGLIDSIGYREDALRLLGRLARLGDHPRTVNLARLPAVERAWTVPGRVAVVYASGAIETGRSGNDLLMGPYMGSETVVSQLERAFHTRGVRAVVMRVESPGGSGLASNLIDHAVQRLKRETGLPFIVSMGAVAGSGGYYISAHGDRIFADRYTRTGSIGVLTLKPSFEGFYAKHGVREEDFERGAYMRGTSTARDWDAEMQATADSAIADYYRGFVAKVADGRRLTWAQVDSVAQGRVWLGEDAREHRLVDEIGGLEQAIAEARRRAGIPPDEKIRLVEFRRPRPWFLERLAGSAVSALWARSTRLPEPGAVYYLADDDRPE